ncbi:MAG: O-antigen ligase family protein [Halothiobacillaceae bacterium]
MDLTSKLHSSKFGMMLAEGSRCRDRNERWALFGLLLFAFSAAPFANVAGVGLGVLFIAFLMSHRKIATWREPVVIFLLVFLGWLSLNLAIGIQLHPQLLRDHFSQALYLLSVPVFTLIVAWAMQARIERIWLVLSTALAGYLLAVLLPLISGEVTLSSFLAGDRHSMRFGHPIRLGLYSTTILLAMLIWLPVWRSLEPRRLLLIGLYLLLLWLVIQALIVSQARVSWIGAAVVLPLVLAARLWLFPRQHAIRPAHRLMMVGGGLLILIAGLFANHDTITDRWTSESATLMAGLQGEEVVFNSIGARFHMWNLGLEKFAERPWLGHGPASPEEYLDQFGTPLDQFSHLHSTPIDLLVRTGLVGLLLMLLFMGMIVQAIIHAWRNELMDKRMLLFAAGALMLLMIDSITGYPISRTQGRFYIALLGGIAYTAFLYRRQRLSAQNDGASQA